MQKKKKIPQRFTCTSAWLPAIREVVEPLRSEAQLEEVALRGLAFGYMKSFLCLFPGPLRCEQVTMRCSCIGFELCSPRWTLPLKT